MTTSARPSRARRAGRAAARALGVAAIAGVAWLALAIHPEPLFAYSVESANLTVHAREPPPPEAGPMLDEVVRRVSRSPFYDPKGSVHVFLSGTSFLHAVLTGGSRGSGVTNPWGNVFIRPADVARGRVFGRDGREKTGERTLTYFVAHEVTHAFVQERLGFLRNRALAAFQREGYADYVAFAHAIDLAAGREALRRGAEEMDTNRSGLYRRYELLVAYLLEKRGWTVEELFARRLDERAITRELLRDPTL